MFQITIMKFLKFATTKLRQNLEQCYDKNSNQNNGVLMLLPFFIHRTRLACNDACNTDKETLGVSKGNTNFKL